MKTVTKFIDRFIGHRIYSATAASNVGHNWRIADTSAAGTPTYAPASTGRGVTLTHDNTSEAQNVCIYFSDLLPFDIDDLIEIKMRVKMGQSAVNAATSLAFGLASARNDAIDSITNHASFRVIGGDSTTLVVVETDDNTTDKDDKATGQTLIDTAKEFTISFATGKADVRFFIDGQPVAREVTFDMSQMTTCFQPYLQLQKTAATSVDAVTLENIEITYRQDA